jgi:hypothetical protein
MTNLSDRGEVSALKSNLHAVFDTPQGKEVMAFLEEACGWYRSVYVQGADRDEVLIADGKRQVLATIKSMLKLSPDQICYLAGDKDSID